MSVAPIPGVVSHVPWIQEPGAQGPELIARHRREWDPLPAPLEIRVSIFIDQSAKRLLVPDIVVAHALPHLSMSTIA
jgi:hypothetical protein